MPKREDLGYWKQPVAGERGFPIGPVGRSPRDEDDWEWAVAIGFCPRCGANARRTCTVRGLFDCPTCTYYWYDERVGEQTRTFDDYFVEA